MRRKVIPVVLAIILMFSLAACNGKASQGGSGDQGQDTETPASGQSQTGAHESETVINVAVGSFATSSIEAGKQAYEAEHPGVRINIIEIPFGSLYEKLNTAFATNTEAYDIAIFPSNWLSEFVEGSYVVSLEKYLGQKDNWDGLIPAYADMQLFKGERYSIPIDGDSIILYYRKDALENQEYKQEFKNKYGYDLNVPSTWQEYRDVAEFFNGWDWDNDGQIEYGTIEAMAPKDVDGYIYLNRALTYAAHPDCTGYAFFNPDTMEPMVSSPAYERALSEWIEIKSFGPPNMINMGGGDQRAAFAAGESALAIDWHDTGIMAQDVSSSTVKEQVGYALSPGTRDIYNPVTGQWDHFDEVQYAPYLAFSGWTTCVTSTCQNPEIATDFLCSLDTDEAALKAVTTAGTARNPYRYDQLEDARAWEESDIQFYKAQEYLDAIMASYTHENIQLDLRIPKAGSYLDALDLGISQAISGDLDVDAALKEVYNAWQEITAEQGIDVQKEYYQNTYSSISTGLEK